MASGLSSPGIFSKSYASAAQTWTLSSTVTLAHGLGVKPKLMQLRLVNLTAEAGYSVGDELVVGTGDAGATQTGFALVRDATNVTVIMGGQLKVPNKTSYTGTNLTAANWAVYVEAFA